MKTLERFGIVLGIIVGGSTLITTLDVGISDTLRIIIMIIIIAIGIIVFIWPKIKPEKIIPKYDAKKLNDTVYKKLMRVSCIYSVFFFSEKMGFVIPSDERAFGNKNGGTYTTWMIETLDMSNEKKYNKLDSVIPQLQVGEKYLKQNYSTIYKQWMNIKNYVKEHNKKHEDYLDYLGKLVMKKVCDVFPAFKNFATIKDENHADIIYLKNIVRLLNDFIQHNMHVDAKTPYYEKKKIFDSLLAHKDNTGKYWVLKHSNVNGEALMFSDRDDAWNIEKMQKILNSILDDPKNTELYQKSKIYDFDELHDKIKSFNDRLENEVVYDIDNQL